MEFEYNQSDDHIEFLKAEYGRRVHKNALYSLNAFARDLSISPSRLSDLLNLKQGLSENSAEKIAEHLGLDSTDARYFKALVARQSARSQTNRAAAQVALEAMRLEFKGILISRDSFRVIQDWYHFALLELIEIDVEKFNAKSASRKLGISLEEAELGLSRLLRLGLVERTASTWTKGKVFSYSGDENFSKAIRRCHKQLLAKASKAVDEQSIDRRYLNSVILSVRSDELAQAKEAVNTFIRDFTRRFGSSAQCDSIYSLSIQFFDLMAEKNNEISFTEENSTSLEFRNDFSDSGNRHCDSRSRQTGDGSNESTEFARNELHSG